MSNREELLLLNDILSAGIKILKFTQAINFKQFMEDEKTQDACIRNFEIIGEASKYISEETMITNPEIEWRKMANYRNLLIHEYFGVNLEIVWDIIKNELEDTIHFIQLIIDKSNKNL
jgi:uncharacterized protein with HEPN domain